MEKPAIFKNKKGKQLVGIFHLPKRKGKFPGVIICHGFNGNKTQRKFVELGRELAKNDIATFRFDFYGSGDSEGNFEKMTIKQEIEDLNCAIKFLRRQKFIDKNKIGLLGHSLGALIATLSASKNSEIKTLVLLAPALNQKALIKDWNTSSQIKKWKKLGYNNTDEFRIGIQYLKETENEDFTEAAKIADVPILIIQGTRDNVIKPLYSKQLFRTLNQIKRLKLIKGGDHNLEEYQVRKKLIEKTVNWFKKYLK